MQNKSEISVMVFLCVHKVAESALIAVMLAAAGLAVLRAEGRGERRAAAAAILLSALWLLPVLAAFSRAVLF